MALINRIGGSGGMKPVGVQTGHWSQNSLFRNRFVTLSDQETPVQSSAVAVPDTDMQQMALQGKGRFSRSPDGSVLWNFSGHSGSQYRVERQDADGNFAALVLPRTVVVPDGAALYGDLVAVSNTRVVTCHGTEDEYLRFHVVDYVDGALTQVASGSCSAHPARANWITLPCADENSFLYLSRDRYLMKGEIADGAITFTVLDAESYRNLEALTHTDEDSFNKMYGGRLPDGRLLLCWNRVREILTCGEEEEYDENLGMTLYWPYETFTYDLYVSLLDGSGTPLHTVTIAQGIQGSRGTTFASALDDILVLSNNMALLQVNTANNQLSSGRKALFVSVTDNAITLQDAPDIFCKTVHWERMAFVGSGWILARAVSFNIMGSSRTWDTFTPQLEFYRLEDGEMTLLYSSTCTGEKLTTGTAGQYVWYGEWSAAGRYLVYGGYWSPEKSTRVRLLARWESGYRCGKAGEQYAGLCSRSSGEDGFFGLLAPEEA